MIRGLKVAVNRDGNKSARVLQGEQTRRAIIENAAELYSQFGYNGVTQRQLADALGITKTLLYHHFDSKEAIHRAVQQYYRELYRTEVLENFEIKSTKISQMIDILERRFSFYREHPEMARMIMWGFLEDSPLEPPSTPETWNHAEELIKNLQKADLLNKSVSPRQIRLMISSIFFGWFVMKDFYMDGSEELSDSEYYKSFLSVFLNGFCTEKLRSMLKRPLTID
ncbi:TetR/AcrR family transcriptional regulator [bacterium]|nr:TetR/AcrR family transcriptional regulator [bacterium]